MTSSWCANEQLNQLIIPPVTYSRRHGWAATSGAAQPRGKMSHQADESMYLHKPEDVAQFRRSKQTYVNTPLFCNHSLLSAGHLSATLRDKQPFTHGALDCGRKLEHHGHRKTCWLCRLLHQILMWDQTIESILNKCWKRLSQSAWH